MRWTDRTVLFGICVMWGLSFSVIKFGLREVPPLLLCAIRFTLVALPAVFFLPRPTVRWPLVMAFGLLMGILQFGLLFFGMSLGISAGLASLVIQAQAFFTMAMAAALAGEVPQQIDTWRLGRRTGLAGHRPWSWG
jgi:O-acetylserine/cysteine efflux transporter